VSVLVDWAVEQMNRETTYYVFIEGTHDLTFDLEYKPRDVSDYETGATMFTFRASRGERTDWVRLKAGTKVCSDLIRLLSNGINRVQFTALSNGSGGVDLRVEAWHELDESR
jgi:hypothetical protein